MSPRATSFVLISHFSSAPSYPVNSYDDNHHYKYIHISIQQQGEGTAGHGDHVRRSSSCRVPSFLIFRAMYNTVCSKLIIVHIDLRLLPFCVHFARKDVSIFCCVLFIPLFSPGPLMYSCPPSHDLLISSSIVSFRRASRTANRQRTAHIITIICRMEKGRKSLPTRHEQDGMFKLYVRLSLRV